MRKMKYRKYLIMYISLFVMFLFIGCGSSKIISNIKDGSASKKSAAPQVGSLNSQQNTNVTQSLITYMKSNDKLQLIGKIDKNLSIHMDMQVANNNLTALDGWWNASALTSPNAIKEYKGTYYYDKYKQNIKIEVRLYYNNYISISEFDDKNNCNGFFSGFISYNSVTGIWLNKSGKPMYSFYLVKDEKEINPSHLISKSDKIGQYLRLNSNDQFSATLSIQSEIDNLFKFNIDGNWHYHIGHIDGIATYTDSTKTKATYNDATNSLNMTFTFSNNIVVVDANNAINGYGGANVSLIGIFQKK